MGAQVRIGRTGESANNTNERDNTMAMTNAEFKVETSQGTHIVREIHTQKIVVEPTPNLKAATDAAKNLNDGFSWDRSFRVPHQIRWNADNTYQVSWGQHGAADDTPPELDDAHEEAIKMDATEAN